MKKSTFSKTKGCKYLNWVENIGGNLYTVKLNPPLSTILHITLAENEVNSTLSMMYFPLQLEIPPWGLNFHYYLE